MLLFCKLLKHSNTIFIQYNIYSHFHYLECTLFYFFVDLFQICDTHVSVNYRAQFLNIRHLHDLEVLFNQKATKYVSFNLIEVMWNATVDMYLVSRL